MRSGSWSALRTATTCWPSGRKPASHAGRPQPNVGARRDRGPGRTRRPSLRGAPPRSKGTGIAMHGDHRPGRHGDSAEHCRKRAEEYRANAVVTRDTDTKRVMIGIAECLEVLA